MTDTLRNLKTFYLYLVSLVGLVTFIIGAISFINVGLIHYVFDLKTPQWGEAPDVICSRLYPENYPNLPYNVEQGRLEANPTPEQVQECIDRTTKSQEVQAKNESLRSLAWAISAILVGGPVWLYHWAMIRRQK
jgi:hypothetical protein